MSERRGSGRRDDSEQWDAITTETVQLLDRAKDLVDQRRKLIREREQLFREFIDAARKFVDDLQR